MDHRARFRLQGLRLVLFGLLLPITFCAAADGPTKPDKPPADKTPRPAAGPGVGLEGIKLPPGAIIITGNDVKDVILRPGMILVPPDEFRKMQDEIDRLKKRLAPDPPELPTRCKVSGRVDGDLVRLQLEIEFETHKPGVLVALGCKKAWPTAVTLDRALPPLLPPGDDGFVVRVDAPGSHQLSMELEAPVLVRGADRGFEIDLPRAAITLLEHLELPEKVQEVRVGGRAIPTRLLNGALDRPPALALGPVASLDVAWKEPAMTPSPVAPLRTAEGQITVRMDDTNVTIEADLTLRLLRGQVNDWQLQLPPSSKAFLVPAPGERVPVPSPAKGTTWTIKPTTPGADSQVVSIQLTLPRTSKPIPIGPFLVGNAQRQRGTITIVKPANLRLRYQTRGDISQRDVTEEQRRNQVDAIFQYWNLPAPAAGTTPQASLDLEVETVEGVIETRVEHALLWTQQGWRLTTDLRITPLRGELDHFDVEVPTDYRFDPRTGPAPASLVEPEVDLKELGPQKQLARLKLVQKRSDPFTLTLTGLYPMPADAQQAAVVLPRSPLTQTTERGARMKALDGGGKVTVTVPAGWKLVTARETQAVADPAALSPGLRTLSWQSDQSPGQVELEWRRVRQELAVDGLADVTLGERQGLVRAQWSLSEPIGSSIQLRGPAALLERLRVVQGGKLVSTTAGGWAVVLAEPAERDRPGPSADRPSPILWPGRGERPTNGSGESAERRSSLVLEYSFAIPDRAGEAAVRRVPIPLVWPDQATRCLTKVRVWSDAGTVPRLTAGRAVWEEQPTEVTDRESLPALVLRGNGLDLPLELSLSDEAESPLASLVVDRVLVQAAIGEGDLRNYRARFLINRLNTRAIDVEFPLPPNGINLDVFLDSKRLGMRHSVDDAGRPTEGGRILRLPVEPSLYTRPVILEVRYQTPPEPREGLARYQALFQPPRLRGHVFVGRTRWQIQLVAGWVPLAAAGDAVFEQRWTWQGALLGPRPVASGAELERWLLGPQASPPGEARGPASEWSDPSLVCSQSSLQPLAILQAPRQTWLLTCSLSCVFLGLGLYCTPLPRRVFWGLLGLLAVVLVAAGVFWTNVLPAVAHGSQPGLLILLIVLGIQWLLHHRYRRQLVFMPGFSRVKGGSSLLRSGSHRGRTEPSTVDVPPGSGTRPAPSGTRPAPTGSGSGSGKTN